jgi:phosphate-selective porin
MADYDKIKCRFEQDFKRFSDKPSILYDIQTPLPNSRHDYCSVCHARYEDYKQHITSDLHKKHVNEDESYKKVDDLIELYFNPKMKPEIKAKKAKTEKRSISE